MLTSIIAVIVVLGPLIFVHELGHFLVAKLLGVRVERFSLGFPPKAIGKKIGETEYMLSWVPLGGYVKMFGENPDEEGAVPPEEEHRSFSHKPAWARFLIVLAGPAFNFIFAIFVFWCMTLVMGVDHWPAKIGPVEQGTPAAQAGLQSGDVITKINGKEILYFDQMDEMVENSRGNPLNISYVRDNRESTTKAIPTVTTYKTLLGDEKQTYTIGQKEFISAYVGDVQEGRPANKAGIQKGDLIISINQQEVKSWYDILRLVRASKGDTVEVILRRDGREMTLNMAPEWEYSQDLKGNQTKWPIIGIASQADVVYENVGPFTAAYMSLSKTWYVTEMTLVTVGKLFQRKVSVKTLGGPIFIAQLAGKQAKTGLLGLIGLAAWLSLNLGILNLLPIPVLDGGHLLFYFLEMIFRRPVSLRIRERAQQAGMLVLMAFMVFVFYNDIARIVTRMTDKNPSPQVEQQVEDSSPGHVDADR